VIQIVFKKLFPKKKKTSSAKLTSQARLKTLTHKLDLKIKDYEKKANLCKMKAKKFLKSGNRQASKTMLVRYKQYQQKVLQYNAMIMKAERHVDALEQADVIKDVATTMESSAAELKAVSTTVNAERAMEITEDAEDSIEQINEASELFAGDPELDFGIDIDEDLSMLETELMLEDAGSLPDAPDAVEATESMSILDDEEDVDESLRSKDVLKDEIAKLRKELDM
jgi:Snf7